jgi:hypothetical protein
MYGRIPPNPGLRQTTPAPAATPTLAGEPSVKPAVEPRAARVGSSRLPLGETLGGPASLVASAVGQLKKAALAGHPRDAKDAGNDAGEAGSKPT